MRNTNDRRQPQASRPYPGIEYEAGKPGGDRRKTRDRRMENLSLEERQLLLSEMPSLIVTKKD